MKMYTAILIKTREVHAYSYEQDGKYGLFIEMPDETPSKFPRPQVLLTSEAVYPTAEAARRAGEVIIAEIRARDLTTLKAGAA